MSPERRKQGPEAEDVWRPTILAQQEGLPLTPTQTRALDLRATSLSIADAIDQLIEDSTIQSDTVREAAAVSQYWEGLLKLQDLGVTTNIHVGDDSDSFDNPLKFAEYVGGQLMTIDGENLPNVRQALLAVKEHSEEEVSLPGSSTDQDRSVFVMSTKNMQPKLKQWIVLRSMVNITHRFLASDLDSSDEDSEATLPPSDEQIAKVVDAIVSVTKKEDKESLPTYETMVGENISETARNMIDIAKRTGKAVRGNFNDVPLMVTSEDTHELIRERFFIDLDRRAEEWRNSPEGQRHKREEEERQQRVAEEESKPIREFGVQDADGWKKIVDDSESNWSQRGIVRFAARWANMMEQRLAKGATVAKVADETSHEADIEGMSGSSFGYAARLLMSNWQHGKDLQKWFKRNH